MSMLDKSCQEFTEVLASDAPVPGGGGASALVGAIGMALGTMVGSLTDGKEKYADVQDQITYLIENGERVRKELLVLVDEDAVAFEPLSKAYGIPKDNPDRDKIMEEALCTATETPMKIMRAVAESVELLVHMEQVGTAIAISDVGVGAACAKAAINGASLNVFINTKSMKDREYAEKVEKEANDLIENTNKTCEEIFKKVMNRIR